MLNVNAHASDTDILIDRRVFFLEEEKSRRRLIGFFFFGRKNKKMDRVTKIKAQLFSFFVLYKSFHAPANKTRSNHIRLRKRILKKKRAGKYTQDGRRYRPTLRATDIHQSIKVSQRHRIHNEAIKSQYITNENRDFKSTVTVLLYIYIFLKPRLSFVWTWVTQNDG